MNDPIDIRRNPTRFVACLAFGVAVVTGAIGITVHSLAFRVVAVATLLLALMYAVQEAFDTAEFRSQFAHWYGPRDAA